MKKIIITAIACAPLVLFGQSLERQVIASAGGYGFSFGKNATYTIGETVTATGSASNIVITQGFQQPVSGSVGIEEMDVGLSVNVYPNPASNEVAIEITSANDLNVSATIYDIQGKQTGLQLPRMKVNGTLKETVDVSSLRAGQYFISFTDEKSTLGTVRIQKVN
jgi:hypothetical protein